jgi:glycine/D-amino acid oxidase-like deaminating enzyme
MFYGFPDLGDGIKIAHHHSGTVIAPGALKNDVTEAEMEEMAVVVSKYLNIDARFNYSSTCMYTNTPDENFIIDFHPRYKNICIASPCSGHGFKFSSLTGKILCDMVMGTPIPLDLSAFSISRF